MGKYVDKRLAEMGAKQLFELGLGDDDANMEDDFITWKDAMWPKVFMNVYADFMFSLFFVNSGEMAGKGYRGTSKG